MEDKPYYDALLKKAFELWTNFIGMIPVLDIVIDIADLCEHYHYQCSNYGSSAGCISEYAWDDNHNRAF